MCKPLQYFSYLNVIEVKTQTLTSSFQSSVPHSSVADLQAPVSERETAQ